MWCVAAAAAAVGVAAALAAAAPAVDAASVLIFKVFHAKILESSRQILDMATFSAWNHERSSRLGKFQL